MTPRPKFENVYLTPGEQARVRLDRRMTHRRVRAAVKHISRLLQGKKTSLRGVAIAAMVSHTTLMAVLADPKKQVNWKTTKRLLEWHERQLPVRRRQKKQAAVAQPAGHWCSCAI